MEGGVNNHNYKGNWLFQPTDMNMCDNIWLQSSSLKGYHSVSTLGHTQTGSEPSDKPDLTVTITGSDQICNDKNCRRGFYTYPTL